MERQILESQTENKTRTKSSSGAVASKEQEDIDYGRLSVKMEQAHQRLSNTESDDEIDSYSRTSPTDSKSVCSSDLNDLDNSGSGSVSGLTPMKACGIGSLIPVNANSSGMDLQSEDSMSVRSFGEESDYASAACSIKVRNGKYII